MHDKAPQQAKLARNRKIPRRKERDERIEQGREARAGPHENAEKRALERLDHAKAGPRPRHALEKSARVFRAHVVKRRGHQHERPVERLARLPPVEPAGPYLRLPQEQDPVFPECLMEDRPGRQKTTEQLHVSPVATFFAPACTVAEPP